MPDASVVVIGEVAGRTSVTPPRVSAKSEEGAKPVALNLTVPAVAPGAVDVMDVTERDTVGAVTVKVAAAVLNDASVMVTT